jgi:hypothetical protein
MEKPRINENPKVVKMLDSFGLRLVIPVKSMRKNTTVTTHGVMRISVKNILPSSRLKKPAPKHPAM